MKGIRMFMNILEHRDTNGRSERLIISNIVIEHCGANIDSFKRFHSCILNCECEINCSNEKLSFNITMDSTSPSTSDIRTTTISNLPSEVLSHIFTFLPHSLKVVRLVCTEWYRACNIEEVAGHETIMVDADQQKKTFVNDFFRNKKHLRQIYRLTLSKMTLKSHYVSFFENFGHNLRYLRFHGCTANEYVPILKHCPNLNTLKLSFWRDSSTLVHLFRSPDGSFVQTHINSLKVGYRASWSDATLDACFRICPQLRSLTLHWDAGKQYFLAQKGVYPFEDGKEYEYKRPDILSFSVHYHALLMRASTLVELELNGLSGILPEQFKQIASIPNLRLRKLKLYDHDGLMNENIVSIVNLQPELRDIRISGCESISSHGLADWIERCPKLTNLKIRTCDEENAFVFDGRLLEALISRPHLRGLELATRNDASILSDFEDCQGTLDHLRKLKLDLAYVDYDRILRKVSVNLTHLSFGDLSGKTIKLISSRFTNLQKFSYGIIDWNLAEDDLVEPMWKFGKLRTLRINLSPVEEFYVTPTKLFNRIEAPNLRVLEIFGFDPIDPTLLAEMVVKYPLLEKFYQYQYGCSCNMDASCLSIIKRWKMLNSFHCDNIQHVHLHRRRIGDREIFESTLQSGESSPRREDDPAF